MAFRFRELSAALVAVAVGLGAQDPAAAATVHMQAGVIKGNGDVKPVARAEFVAVPWDPLTASKEIQRRKFIPDPPDPSKYLEIHEDLLSVRKAPTPKYFEEYQSWQESIKDGTDVLAEGRKAVRFKTDLQGQADFDVQPGRYRVIGLYGDSFSSIGWDAELNVSGDTKLVLSNDNASFIVNASSETSPYLYATRVDELSKIKRNIIFNDGIYFQAPLGLETVEPTILGRSIGAIGISAAVLGIGAVCYLTVAAASRR